MLTEKQYERLPALLQELIDVDRELAELQARAVTPIDRSHLPVREFELIGRRAGLLEAAGQIWGTQLRTNRGGPAHA